MLQGTIFTNLQSAYAAIYAAKNERERVKAIAWYNGAALLAGRRLGVRSGVLQECLEAIALHHPELAVVGLAVAA